MLFGLIMFPMMVEGSCQLIAGVFTGLVTGLVSGVVDVAEGSLVVGVV
jgi:hypothetical protein